MSEKIMNNGVMVGMQDSTITIITGVEANDIRLMVPTKIDTEEWIKRKRNTFACVSCHSSKQKCVPSDLNDIFLKPCQRCSKSNKTCKFDLAKRTRKRKNFQDSSLESSPLSISHIEKRAHITPIQGNNVSIKNRDLSNQFIPESIPLPMQNIQQSFIQQPPTQQLPTQQHQLQQPIMHQTLIQHIIPQSLPFQQLSGSVLDSSVQSPRNTLPGIQQSLSDLWPTIKKAVSYDNVVELQNTPVQVLFSPKNVPSPTASLPNPQGHSKEKCNARYKKGSHSLTITFKKQLRSLLVNQKGKVGDLYEKFNLLSEKWNTTLLNSHFINKVSDPISLGIINHEEATFRLNLYRNEISHNCKLPFIKISTETTIDRLRSEKPIFFSAIMSIVSVLMSKGDTTLETNLQLDSFILHQIKNQLFRTNSKSIDLLEALLTLCLWYNIPEWSSKTHYHLFNYICCVLTRDLGPTFVNRSFGMFSDEEPDSIKKKYKTPLEIYENGPRLTLLTYVSALNISLFLRQNNHIRWSSLTEKACEVVIRNCGKNNDLYNEEDDRMLVTFVKLNHMLEKINLYLHEKYESDENLDDPEYSQRHTQNLILRYQIQLNEILLEIPQDRQRLLSFYYSVEAFLHQFVLRRYLINNENPGKLTEEVRKAFIRCYECCVTSLKEFLKLSPLFVASLPLFHMSRIIYTVGLLLLKARYSSVSIPIFHEFREMTDCSVKLVNQVSELLERTAQKYVYNNFIYKFQYVIALFVQTYANKVMEEANAYEKRYRNHDKELARLKNESVQRSSFSDTKIKVNVNPNTTDKISTRNISDLIKDVPTPTDIPTSPSVSSTNLNEYLTDIDSLVLGFNALNDEFWTDIFDN